MEKRCPIGKMREAIEILSVSDAPSGTFSLARSYVSDITVRASVIDITGTRVRESRSLSRQITHLFIIRAGVSVDSDKMIRWKGKLYSVEDFREIGQTPDDRRRNWLEIQASFQEVDGSYDNVSPEPLPEPEPEEEEEEEEQ